MASAGSGRVVARLAALVVVAVALGVLGLGLLIAPAIGLRDAAAAGSDVLDSPDDLAIGALAQTSVMLAADGSVIAHFYDLNRTSVPLTQMSPLVRKAVVAIEDARFYDHRGVDGRGVARAVVNGIAGGSPQGASTLHAADLTLPQAATLAGMVQEPTADNPIQRPEAARARRDVVLKAMLDQELIDRAGYEDAVRSPVVTDPTDVPDGCAHAQPGWGFFCEYVVRSIVTDPAYRALGTTPGQRTAALDRGGLTIRTTMDPRLQAAAGRAVERAVPADDPSRLGAAAVTVEPGTGRVLAMAQNRTYQVAAGNGSTTVNYSVDAALGGSRGFQTGSAFKPFTLATWLAKGNLLSDPVDATPRAFGFGEFTACGQRLRGTAPYTPGNAEGRETGEIDVRRATVDSVNVAYVDMQAQLDLCDIAATAQGLGVRLAAPEQECGSQQPASTDLPTCLPSLTLGVKSIAPLTMAAAYAGFASGGTYCPPTPVAAVTGPSGEQLPVPADTCRTALPAGVAAGVTDALRGVLTDGTARTVGPVDGYDSAGKTGTTDGPLDTWFVGYTAQRATAVWVGDPGTGDAARRQLTDITVAGRFHPIVYGATIAAPIWKDVMTAAQRGLPARPLP